MNDRTKNIISIILLAIVSLMLLMSSIFKIIGAEQAVTGLTSAGLGKAILPIGIMELAIVIMLWIKPVRKIAFLLLCSYLGGAASIEIANGNPPGAFIFIAVSWIAVYLRDKSTFF